MFMADSVLRALFSQAGVSGTTVTIGESTGMGASVSTRAGVVGSEACEEAGLEKSPRITGRGRFPGVFAANFFSLRALRLAELAADLSQ